MPQSFHVLRCFSCSIFQVHIVKKVNKWQCKVCNEKQSVKKVYGEGSSKDCRNHVQRLNSLQLAADQECSSHPSVGDPVSHKGDCPSVGNPVSHEGNHPSVDNPVSYERDQMLDAAASCPGEQPRSSKWSQYVQPSRHTSSSSEEEHVPNIQKTRTRKAPHKTRSRQRATKPGSSKWDQYVALSDDEDCSVQTCSSNTKLVDIRSSQWRDFHIQHIENAEDEVPQQSQQNDKITNDWGQFATASTCNPTKKQKLVLRDNCVRDSKNESWLATGKCTEVKKQWSDILDQNKVLNVETKSTANTLTTSLKHEPVSSKWGKYLACDPCEEDQSQSCQLNRHSTANSKQPMFDSGDISDEELDKLLQF